MKLIALINPENISESDVNTFAKRFSSRGLVYDGNKIAFLKVNKNNYHKLPGGGSEGDENYIETFIREIKEEVGCDVEIEKEIGKTVEYKGEYKTVHESHVFISRKVGEIYANNLTEREKENGFELIWVDLDTAIELLKNDNPNNYVGKFIIERDLAILEEAKKY